MYEVVFSVSVLLRRSRYSDTLPYDMIPTADKTKCLSGVTARDILERIADGDDVSDFSDLSESDDEDWKPPDNCAPDDHESDQEAEADGDCGPTISSSSLPRNRWEKELLKTSHPQFSRIFSYVDEQETPIALFRKLLTREMLEMLVNHTSLYSTQKCGSSVNTDLQELEQYIGMYLQMGLVKMPNVRCYWENGTRHSPIADAMSRNRFTKLMRSLHVVDNLGVTEEQKKDKLWKLRPWLSKLHENFQAIEQEEWNAVDEIMVSFTGRSHLKQYIPNKPETLDKRISR